MAKSTKVIKPMYFQKNGSTPQGNGGATMTISHQQMMAKGGVTNPFVKSK